MGGFFFNGDCFADDILRQNMLLTKYARPAETQARALGDYCIWEGGGIRRKEVLSVSIVYYVKCKKLSTRKYYRLWMELILIQAVNITL